MLRRHRFAPPEYFHHITQRGNYGQRTFFFPHHHELFLDLISLYAPNHAIEVLGYCTMSNHYHLFARSAREHGISNFLQDLNGRYAQLLHAFLRRRGRFWQSRFYGCVLHESYLPAALRYVEQNPLRSRRHTRPEDYPWSSAACHTGAAKNPPEWLDLATFHTFTNLPDWHQLLATPLARRECAAIRSATYQELPLGDIGFIEQLEAAYHVDLRRIPPGTSARIARLEARKAG